MSEPLRVLVVEDSEDDCLRLLRELGRGGYAAHHRRVETASAMRSALNEEHWDVIFADHEMPAFNAPGALEVLRERGLDLSFIVVSGKIGEEAAVAAMKAGAHDYINKADLFRVSPAIERELRAAEIRHERRRSEERFRRVLEQAADALLVHDLEGNLVDVNRQTCESLGYTREELLKMSVADVEMNYPRGSLLEVWAGISSGSPRTLEGLHRRKDGATFPVEVRVGVFEVDGDRLILAMARDITERRRSEEALRESEKRFRSLLEVTNDVIWDVDDDYHVIDSEPIDSALTFLLNYLPPQMHLVIATREDPQLPLARLRARGQSTELRATDLRFVPDEAAEFLKGAMGLDLSAEDIAALESRTEGWIAGLQMAALSMQGREDIASFIKSFTGSHHFVLDYLVEEVLQRQPERARSFLLQTSILDRLSGPLCDAVTRHENSKGALEALERGNLFVVPLDDERQWYRYHHLFAHVLQSRAMEEQPDQVPTLHRRASEWYEHNDLSADAIRHALAAGDFERAADLVEVTWPAMDRSFQSATWLGWAKALPDELVRVRPVLSAGYARALLDVGELEAVEARLRDAERWLDKTAVMNQRPDERSEVPSAEISVTGMVVVDEEQFRSLPASIATARAAHTQALGDMFGAMKYARQALDLLPEGNYYERGVLAALLGVAYWAGGDLKAAHTSFANFMANMRMAGNILVAISGTFILADIRMAQGRLHEAVRTYEQSLQLAMAQGEPVLQGTADLYVELGQLQCEQGDLEVARQHLLKSKDLGEHAALPELQYRSCVAEARIKEAEGDLDGALDLLDEAERQHYLHAAPDIRPVAALCAGQVERSIGLGA